MLLHLQYHLTLTTLACPKRPLTLPPLARRPRLAKHLSLRLKSTPLTRLPRLGAFYRTPHSASIAEHVEFMLVSATPKHTPQADALTTKNYMQPNSVMKGCSQPHSCGITLCLTWKKRSSAVDIVTTFGRTTTASLAPKQLSVLSSTLELSCREALQRSRHRLSVSSC